MYPNDAVNTKLSSHLSATETGWRHNALDGRLFPNLFLPERQASWPVSGRSRRSEAHLVQGERRVIIGLLLNLSLLLGRLALEASVSGP